MVVVGGRSSANTKELTRLCGIVGTPAIQIEHAADLDDAAVFDGKKVIGVTGGTSTPIEDLRDVAERVLEIAGTPKVAARAAELAQEALAGAATPAGRTTSLPKFVHTEGATQTARRRLTLVASSSLAGLPVVAVVGRPNVGKSTLFNRIVGTRQAIVEDRARTTRDRMYGDSDWNGRRFVIVDTGGLEVDPADPIELKVQEQARLAIREADVIVFLVDAVTGLTPGGRGGGGAASSIDEADHRRRQQDRQHAARGRRGRVLLAGLGGDLPDLGVARPRYRRPARRDRLGAAAGDRPGDRAQGEGEGGRRVGEGGRRRAPRAVRRRRRGRGPRRDRCRPGDRPGCGRPLGCRDRGVRRRRACRDRVRRPAERRQVIAPERAAGRGSGDRLGGSGDDPRRDRHDPRLGSERDRPDRHRRDQAPRQGRLGPDRPSASRRSAR